MGDQVVVRRAGEGYHGLSDSLQTSAGPMWISVARTEGSDALIKSVLREFVFDTMWVTPLLMLATLGIGVVVIDGQTRTEISEHVWDVRFDTDSNVIDVYINMLRKKIDQPYEKKLLQTVVGAGYVLKE